MSAWHEKYRSMFAGDGFERLTAPVPQLGFLRVDARERDLGPRVARAGDCGLAGRA